MPVLLAMVSSKAVCPVSNGFCCHFVLRNAISEAIEALDVDKDPRAFQLDNALFSSVRAAFRRTSSDAIDAESYNGSVSLVSDPGKSAKTDNRRDNGEERQNPVRPRGRSQRGVPIAPILIQLAVGPRYLIASTGPRDTPLRYNR